MSTQRVSCVSFIARLSLSLFRALISFYYISIIECPLCKRVHYVIRRFEFAGQKRQSKKEKESNETLTINKLKERK